MADRFERVRAHVLLEISDDFEEIGQIMIQLHRVASLGITREEVKAALVSLVKDGFANVYYFPSLQEPLPALPPPETFEEHYFYITPEGTDKLYTFPKEWFPSWNED